MFTALRRTLLGVVASLVVASSASAECAWVLWEETILYRPDEGGPDSGTRTISVQDGYVSNDECVGGATGRSNALLKDLQHGQWSDSPRVLWFKRFDPSPFILIRYKDGSRRSANWICLPDTVNPRGPKGT